MARFDTGCPCCRDDFYDYEEWLMQRVSFVSHPLALDALARLRDPALGGSEFARRLRALGAIICYRALEGESVAGRATDAPGGSLLQPMPDMSSIVFAPLSTTAGELAAGMSIVAPGVVVAHVAEAASPDSSLFRDRLVICVEAILSTGDSEIAAIAALKEAGAREVRYACALAAPEGIEKLRCAHPDVDMFVVGLDSHLDTEGRVTPGIGDIVARLSVAN